MWKKRTRNSRSGVVGGVLAGAKLAGVRRLLLQMVINMVQSDSCREQIPLWQDCNRNNHHDVHVQKRISPSAKGPITSWTLGYQSAQQWTAPLPGGALG